MSSEPMILVWAALFITLCVGVAVIVFKRSPRSGKEEPDDRQSTQETEGDVDYLRLARAAHARGDYEESIDYYKAYAALDHYNRLPWVEIAKIQHDNLEDPKLATETLKNALEGQDWAKNDAAYFMIRMAEIHWQDLGDQRTGSSILNQVIECFPDSKHSANAVHLLHKMHALVDHGEGSRVGTIELEAETAHAADDTDGGKENPGVFMEENQAT